MSDILRPMKSLLPVDEALRLVLESTPILPPEAVCYDQALGRVLRDEVRATDPYPDFDKSLMDGYAVIAADLETPPATLQIDPEIPAGSDPARLRPIRRGRAARIMTGAPLPPGADAVVIVEETAAVDGHAGCVLVRSQVSPGANIAPRGGDVRPGDLLLGSGEFLGPAEIGVLAALGRTTIRVGGRPRVAVLATGDELVEAGDDPGPGCIRNSNGPLLTALARRAGAEARSLGIAPDDPTALRRAISEGLTADVLLLSGGVSMGTHDLVGEALRSLHVEILFEKVAIKPGKPFIFGRKGTTLVFGCPGNPVSGYVIFQVFVRPALRRMSGGIEAGANLTVRAYLEHPVRQKAGRTGYYQARIRWDDDRYRATVLKTSGSADFVSCARGNALVIVPADSTAVDAEQPVEALLLDDHAER